eukprot:5177191-Alexandrium_andersonii.AAC.1
MSRREGDAFGSLGNGHVQVPVIAHHALVKVMVLMTSPQWPQAQSAELSRGRLGATYRTECEYDDAGLPKTAGRLVPCDVSR